MTKPPIFVSIRGQVLYSAPLGAESVILDLGANRGEFASLNLAIHPIPVLQRLRWTLRTSAPGWLRYPWHALPPGLRRHLRGFFAKSGGVNDEAWGSPSG